MLLKTNYGGKFYKANGEIVDYIGMVDLSWVTLEELLRLCTTSFDNEEEDFVYSKIIWSCVKKWNSGGVCVKEDVCVTIQREFNCNIWKGLKVLNVIFF